MWNLIVQAMVGIGGSTLVGSAIMVVAMRRKVRAEASKVHADAAKVLTDSAMSMMEEVREDLMETQRELRALRRHVGKLEGILRQNGIAVPDFVWPPTERLSL